MSSKKKTAASSPAKQNLSEKKIYHEASYSYVFSMPWFIGGVAVVAVFALILFASRTIHVSRMSDQIILMADTLEEDGKIREAIDVLTAYLSAHRDNPKVWQKQCDLWKTLMDKGEFQNVSQMRRAITNMKLASGILEDNSAIKEHVLELEYSIATEHDSSMLLEALIDAKQLLTQQPDHPKAMRILALGSFDQLRRIGSPTVNFQDFSVDQLLLKAKDLSPDDVSLAIAAADMILDAPTFRSDRYISTAVLNMSDEDRKSEAIAIVNTVVDRNQGNAQAYLDRFSFRQRHGLIDSNLTTLDPDLEMALRIEPESEQVLLTSGRFLQRMTRILRIRKDFSNADNAFDRAEKLLKEVRDRKPENESGYLALGELYFSEKMLDLAIETWESGRKNSSGMNPELRARLCMIYLDQKEFKKAEGLINELESYYRDIGSRLEARTELTLRVLYRLLRSKYYMALRSEQLELARSLQGQLADAKAAGSANVASLEEQLQKARSDSLKWRNQARDQLNYVLNSLTEVETDFSGVTTISNLEGEAYIEMGRLEAEFGAWDEAVKRFETAMKFPQFAPQAIQFAYQAYRQLNRNDAAMNLLREGVQKYPTYGVLRSLYVENIFAQEMRKSSRQVDFETLEKELGALAELKDSLQQPWLPDLLKIQLQYVKDGGTRVAQESAMSALQNLEKTPEYAEDVRLFTELAGQYSTLGALDDFNRAAAQLKSLPGGIVPYYTERLKDAQRRRDLAQTLDIAKEAATQVPEANKALFNSIVAQIENPETQGANSDELFKRLLGEYENDMIFDPKTFFELANLALDRGEIDVARNIEGRLKKLEGDSGTMWKYVASRVLVKQAGNNPSSPLLVRAREIQQEIAKARPAWNKGFVLLAEIEKESKNIKGAIAAYKMALETGNTEIGVYQDLIALLYSDNKPEDAEKVRQAAFARFGSRFQSGARVLPEPYQGYYEQVYQALQEGNAETAERLAATCIQRAVEKSEPSDRIAELNRVIGKLFFDSEHFSSAEPYLEALAERGGQFVHALAVCYAKMGRPDDAFGVYLRELEAGNDVQIIIEYIVKLSADVHPSEAVWEKIEKQVDRRQPMLLRSMPSCMLSALFWTMREKDYKAIPYYQAALVMEPDRWEILNNLALILADMDGNEPLPITNGRFTSDAPKRIPVITPAPKSELIIRFPGSSTAPRAQEFRFFAVPEK